MAKVPKKVAEKWRRRTEESVQDYKDSVMEVSVSPGVKANENLAGYRAGVIRAIDNGDVERGNLSYTLNDWQEASVENADRLGTGAMRNEGKVEAVMAELLPAQERIKANLTPRGDKAANKRRMDEWFEESSKLRGKFRKRRRV